METKQKVVWYRVQQKPQSWGGLSLVTFVCTTNPPKRCFVRDVLMCDVCTFGILTNVGSVTQRFCDSYCAHIMANWNFSRWAATFNHTGSGTSKKLLFCLVGSRKFLHIIAHLLWLVLFGEKKNGGFENFEASILCVFILGILTNSVEISKWK